MTTAVTPATTWRMSDVPTKRDDEIGNRHNQLFNSTRRSATPAAQDYYVRPVQHCRPWRGSSL